MTTVSETTASTRRRRRRQQQQQQRRRRRRETAPVEASTSTTTFVIPHSFIERIPSTQWIMHTATKAIWAHVLYSHGIVPWPVHQVILAATRTTTPRTTTLGDSHYNHKSKTQQQQQHIQRQRRINRHIDKLRDSLQTVLQDLQDIFSCGVDVQAVCLSWGSSFQRPRSVFQICLPKTTTVAVATVAAAVDANHHPSAANENDSSNDSTADCRQEEHVLSSRLIRHLISSSSSSSSSSPSLSSQQNENSCAATADAAHLSHPSCSSSTQMYVTLGIPKQSLSEIPDNVMRRLVVRREVLELRFSEESTKTTRNSCKSLRETAIVQLQYQTRDDGTTRSRTGVLTTTEVTDNHQTKEQELAWLSLRATIKSVRLPTYVDLNK